MAGLNSNVFSLIDATKRLNPNGSVETGIAELLTQNNELLYDMMWKEGNLPTGHRLTMRSALPTGTWRKFNQGITPTKSTTVQVDETCAMYEQKGAIDKDLAGLNGEDSAFRMTENIGHMIAMNNDMATAMFYAGISTTPEKFDGLAVRYSSLSAANAQNIIDAGGTSTDNTSVWLIGWSDRGIYGIYPKGSKGGLQHTPIQDNSGDGCIEYDDGSGTGATYRAYVDRYQWKCGLAVKDWQYAVRICNIKVGDLTTLASTQSNTAVTQIIYGMSRAIDRVPTDATAKFAFYANRTVFSWLKIQALNKSSGALSIEDALMQFGDTTVKAKQPHFLGIPIRRCDAIVNNETRVT